MKNLKQRNAQEKETEKGRISLLAHMNTIHIMPWSVRAHNNVIERIAPVSR